MNCCSLCIPRSSRRIHRFVDEYPPAIEQIAPSETPIQIPATDNEMDLAWRCEQSIRELIERSGAVD